MGLTITTLQLHAQPELRAPHAGGTFCICDPEASLTLLHAHLQIRATFHLPDDLTEEEKLEPIKNLGDDSRISLLNRLYSKRRKVCPANLLAPLLWVTAISGACPAALDG